MARPPPPVNAVPCWSRLVCLLGFTGLVAMGLWRVLFAELNADEGFYLLASRLVAGGWRPYRDFGFSQMPLVPWANLPGLAGWGWDLAGLRLTSLTWTLATVLLGAWLLQRRHGWRVAAAMVGLLLGAPGWLSLAVLGKTYAVAGLAVLVAAASLTSRAPLALRWTGLLLAAALGTAARLPMAAFFAAAGLGLWGLTPGWKARAGAVAATVLLAAATLGLVAGDRPDLFQFWVADYLAASLLPHHVGRSGGLLLAMMPGIVVLGLGAAVWAWRAGNRTHGVALAAVILGVLANVAPPGTYTEYAAPLVPAAAFLTAAGWAEVVPRLRRHWLVALAVLVTVAGGVTLPPSGPNVLRVAGEATAFLARHTPADSVVIASMPEIAVAAQRRVPRELAMGKFALTEVYADAEAQARHLVTPAQLAALMVDAETSAVVLSSGVAWNFSWSMPGFGRISDEGLASIRGTLERHYRLAFTNELYVIFLRTDATGRVP